MCDLAVVNLDVDRVDEDHRIDRVEGVVLPVGHIFEHSVIVEIVWRDTSVP
jgi:hypothetical protein